MKRSKNNGKRQIFYFHLYIDFTAYLSLIWWNHLINLYITFCINVLIPCSLFVFFRPLTYSMIMSQRLQVLGYYEKHQSFFNYFTRPDIARDLCKPCKEKFGISLHIFKTWQGKVCWEIFINLFLHIHWMKPQAQEKDYDNNFFAFYSILPYPPHNHYSLCP